MNATTTATQAEIECREFVAEFPTPQAKRALWLCETGQLSWVDVHKVFRGALAKGLAETK